jgi:uncharacterized protein YcnI
MNRLRIAAATTITGIVVMAGAGAAAAHVTVSSPDASAGGYGKLVFRVPSESDTASTTTVSVSLPTDTPLASVAPKVLPGWTVAEQMSKLDQPITNDDGFTVSKAVSRVTWTAAGDGIPPEQFDEFELSVGPFPEGVSEMRFPTVQTYSDGTVVKWDEVATGSAEPEHPAPTLSFTASGDDAAGAADASLSGSDSGESDGTARVLAGAALLVALIAAGIAALSFGRGRGRSA